MKNTAIVVLLIIGLLHGEEIDLEKFGGSKIFCYWGYGIGGDETYEYKCLKNGLINDSNYKSIYEKTTIIWKLYCCLYMKFYSVEEYKKCAEELRKDTQTDIDFMIGCKGMKLKVNKVVDKIESVVFDWNGTSMN